MAEKKSIDELKKELDEKLKTAEKREKSKKKLSDEELSNVSGGYWETSGYTSGDWIECPNCGEHRRSMIDTWIQSDDLERDGFYCYNCGTTWAEDHYAIYW